MIKILECSFETLGRKFNSIKLCIHLNISRVASEIWSLHLDNIICSLFLCLTNKIDDGNI